MKTKLLLLVFASILGACATIPPKNPAAIDKVKTVAVVGITVLQPDTDNIGKLTGIKTEGYGVQVSPHVVTLFDGFNKALEQNLGWKTKAMKDLTTNAVYADDYNKTMKGWQSNMGGPTKGQTQYGAALFMDADALRKLGPEGRKKLAESLNVDAIAAVVVRVNMGGTRFAGLGTHKPQTDVAFQVFDRENEHYIWNENRLAGVESDKSLGASGFVDFNYLNELAEVSARTAYSQIRK